MCDSRAARQPEKTVFRRATLAERQLGAGVIALAASERGNDVVQVRNRIVVEVRQRQREVTEPLGDNLRAQSSRMSDSGTVSAGPGLRKFRPLPGVGGMVIQDFLDPPELGREERGRGRFDPEHAIRSRGPCLRGRPERITLALPSVRVQWRSNPIWPVETGRYIVRAGGQDRRPAPGLLLPGMGGFAWHIAFLEKGVQQGAETPSGERATCVPTLETVRKAVMGMDG